MKTADLKTLDSSLRYGFAPGPPALSMKAPTNFVVRATADDKFVFCGRSEKIYIDEMSSNGPPRFHILTNADMIRMLGHQVLVDGDGKPMLGEYDDKVFQGAMLIRHNIIENPTLSAKRRRELVEEIKREFAPEFAAPKSKRTFDDALVDFNLDEISELLGRPIMRSPDGHHVLSEAEVTFIGTVLGTLDGTSERAAAERPSAIAKSLARMSAEFGQEFAHRAALFLRKHPGRARSVPIDPGLLDRVKAASKDVFVWLQSRPVALERATGSQLHKINEAMRAKQLIGPNPAWFDLAKDGLDAQDFVVQHDWAKAFAGAGDFDGGEFSLPFDDMIFEFQVSGRRVCLAASVGERDTMLLAFISTPVGWFVPARYNFNLATGTTVAIEKTADVGLHEALQPMMDLLVGNIRAISIALEAEAATTDVVRADYKLNHAREKRGKLPIFDYHVVSLARRQRAASLPPSEIDPDREIVRRRCHFRRGHWRHFVNHKTWIRWQLVGDPDLGFVDKHYKL